MNRLRLPALVALWLQVVALFTLAAYALWQDNFGLSGWLSGIEAFLAGLVLAWWTLVFARVTGPQGAVTEPGDIPHNESQRNDIQRDDIQRDGNWRALLVVYPWLTTFRASLWLITLLGILAGVAPTANPVAVTAMLTIWGAAIWASNASNAGLLRLATEPQNPLLRQQLLDWLNLAAALSFAMTIMNLVPITGYSDPPNLTSQLVYGIEGFIDVVATLLSFGAIYNHRTPTKQEG